MNAELKQKWVFALRSGNFKQSKYYTYTAPQKKFFGLIQTPPSYCALGVLGIVAKNNHESGYDNDLINYSKRAQIIELNDKDDRSFNEIANFIEKNF